MMRNLYRILYEMGIEYSFKVPGHPLREEVAVFKEGELVACIILEDGRSPRLIDHLKGDHELIKELEKVLDRLGTLS